MTSTGAAHVDKTKLRRKTANIKQLTVDEPETQRKLTGDKAENEKADK